MPAVASLAAGIWYLALAAGLVVGGRAGSASAFLFALTGAVLVIVGVRMAAGHVPAVRTARRAAALALAVALVPVALVLITLAVTGDAGRLRLAAGDLGRSAAGIVPAAIVLLIIRKERKPGSSANG